MQENTKGKTTCDRVERGETLPEFLDKAIRETKYACEVVFPGGKRVSYGVGAPVFRIVFKSSNVFRQPLNELSIGRAYVNGEFDIDGDMMCVLDLRNFLRSKDTISVLLKFTVDLIVNSPLREVD